MKIIPAEELKKKEKSSIESGDSPNKEANAEKDPKSETKTKSDEKAPIQNVITQTMISPETVPSRFNSESTMIFVVKPSGNSGTIFQLQVDEKESQKNSDHENPANQNPTNQKPEDKTKGS